MLVDKIEGPTEDERTDLVTVAQQFATRIYKKCRVKGEEDYLDP